jgi:organic radical activating enzyme
MTNYDSLIKNVMLFGGEPLDQPLIELIEFIE